MIICINGICREATEEETRQIMEIPDSLPEEHPGSESALDEFFSGLASSETNSIAKIRQLAQAFLEKTGG